MLNHEMKMNIKGELSMHNQDLNELTARLIWNIDIGREKGVLLSEYNVMEAKIDEENGEIERYIQSALLFDSSETNNVS